MIEQKLFGKTHNKEDIFIFTLKNTAGAAVEILQLGGAIRSFFVPDKNGNKTDVVLGYKYPEGYLAQNKYMGALIGRYANRIEKGRFILNDTEYILEKNDGNNHLHGGIWGFDKKLWQYKIADNALHLYYKSNDAEEGYPGNLSVFVTYRLDDENCLFIEYMAQSDKDTIVNLTNHSYFNLSGKNKDAANCHTLQIFADTYTECSHECIPTGVISPVEGTPFDFRIPKQISKHINEDNIQLKNGGGYDHNYVLNKKTKTQAELCARAYCPDTGITLEIYTTMPGLQFYSGNFMACEIQSKQGPPYKNREAFCLETQYFPNSTAHKTFPSPVLKKGELYYHVTKYKFITDKNAI